MEPTKEDKIALLIDGDNAEPKFIDKMFAEASKHGRVTIRRIYGDFTQADDRKEQKPNRWKEQIIKYAIKPIQKFAIAQSKNSSDIAMVIEAMDILHSKTVTGFCIASSDSDYTGLAQRIREEGIFIMGVGEAEKTTKAKEAFTSSYDKFIFTENLELETETKETLEKDEEKGKEHKQHKTQTLQVDTPRLPGVKVVGKIELPKSRFTKKPIDLELLRNAFDMVVDDTGLAYMGRIGDALIKLDSSFHFRTYGYSSLTALFKSLSKIFELEYKDNGSSIYIKLKEQTDKK